MKTDTRERIIELIKIRGALRPKELARILAISPQALHRQLKALVTNHELEIQGRPPSTLYKIGGIPDFAHAFGWLKAQSSKNIPQEKMCETRDVFVARLSAFKAFLKKGLNSDELPLLISVVGEVGNNSFDHNLGKWVDQPGCWLETQVTGAKIWVCIADRGQGVYNSLKRVDPNIKDDQAALKTAFEKFISGRAPEQRGNGLKFVKKIISNAPGLGLACASGKGQIYFGAQGENCLNLLNKSLSKVNGTITLLNWSLK
jgi:hypothetical protein